MRKYEGIKNLSPANFRRLTGVKRETFEKMTTLLVDAQNRRYRKAGRKGSLCVEDKLLMTLEYLREY